MSGRVRRHGVSALYSTRAASWGVALLLALVAAASLAASIVLATGGGGNLHVGPLVITLHDYTKPLLWGTGSASVLLILGWAHPLSRLAAIGVVLALILLGGVNFARKSPPIVTASDLAVTELYTEIATHGRLFVGPYSRYGWHHPGPAYFYAQAPLYVASDRRAASLYVGALLMGVASIVTVAWVAARSSSALATIPLVAASAFFAWRLPRFLGSPWTAHVPILPSLALAALSAAVASGRSQLLPLVMLFGGFVAQTHIALVPVVVILTLLALAPVLIRYRQGDLAARSSLRVAAWTAAVIWLLPMREALDQGGNLAALWSFFVSDPSPGQSFSDTLRLWSYALAGVLRSDLELPWGSQVEIKHAAWPIALSLAEVCGLGFVAYISQKRGQSFRKHFAIALLLCSALAFLAISRIPDRVRNHEVLWLTALGAMNLGVLVSAALDGRSKTPEHKWTHAVAAVGCLTVLALTVMIGVNHLQDLTAFELRQRDRSAVVDATEAIRRTLAAEGIVNPLIEMDDQVWTDGAAVILRLHQGGTALGMTDKREHLLTDTFRLTGREDAVIHIADRTKPTDLRQRPGSRVVFERGRLAVEVIPIQPVGGR